MIIKGNCTLNRPRREWYWYILKVKVMHEAVCTILLVIHPQYVYWLRSQLSAFFLFNWALQRYLCCMLYQNKESLEIDPKGTCLERNTRGHETWIQLNCHNKDIKYVWFCLLWELLIAYALWMQYSRLHRQLSYIF